jgi:general secretion pathway protein L
LVLTRILPVPRTTPADYDLSRDALPYATALAGACPRLALAANLLPAEYRSSSSRAMFIPTAALALALLLLLGGLAVQATLRDRGYLAKLEAEIARLEPRARKVSEAERSIDVERARIRLLDGFRRRTRSDLDALNELTKMLKPPGWLNALELTRDSVTLFGEAEQAAPLLKILDGSPLFQNSEFTMPLSRGGDVERFRIRASREGVVP